MLSGCSLSGDKALQNLRTPTAASAPFLLYSPNPHACLMEQVVVVSTIHPGGFLLELSIGLHPRSYSVRFVRLVRTLLQHYRITAHWLSTPCRPPLLAPHLY